MKHLIITAAIAIASIFNTAKAAGPITPQVIASFKNTYLHATDVQWTDLGNYYRISFKIEGKTETAYYDVNGNHLGTTRNISTSEITPRLKANLQKHLNDGYVSELFVMTQDKAEVYFAVIEHADSKVVLKSDNGRKWSHYKTEDKK